MGREKKIKQKIVLFSLSLSLSKRECVSQLHPIVGKERKAKAKEKEEKGK